MRVKEVAERLDVSQATIDGLIASGKLRCYRIGNGRGVVRVSEEQLRDFLKVFSTCSTRFLSMRPCFNGQRKRAERDGRHRPGIAASFHGAGCLLDRAFAVF